MENSPDMDGIDGFVQELTGCQDDLIVFIRALCGDFHLASDIRQEVNMVLWRKREKFTPGTSFRSWAYRIAHLILGGVEVPSGSYNSSHPTYGSYFTGTGSLVIAGGYNSWAQTKDLDGSNNGLTQDADHDGISNLAEFYLNGNPLANDPSILPASALDATYLTFTFHRRDDAEADVTAQNFQYGSSLVGWTSVPIGATSAAADGNGVIVMVSENATNPDLITVQIPRDLAGSGKLFGRLQVTK